MTTTNQGPGHGSAAPEADIIALRGGPRASLRQRRARDFVADLFDHAGAAKRIRALPEQQLAFLIREIGLGDALDLLRAAAPEQIQACVDLECWQRDRLEPERFQMWLEALAEVGPAHLAAAVTAMDHELLVTFFAQRVRVYEVAAEEAPEEPQGHFYHTPDRFYTVDVLADGQNGYAIDRILESLYMADIDLGRRVVMGARWDLGAETEEAAYRFRSGRLADLGYVDYYDALRIYSFLDPKTVHIEERVLSTGSEDTLFLPPELADVLSNHSGLFSRALAALSAPDRAVVLRDLLFLLNHVLSAERIDPGDLTATRPELATVVDTLCLALESLLLRERSAAVAEHRAPVPAAAGAPSAPPASALAATGEGQDSISREAVRLVRGVPLSRLFRLGHSLTLQVARLGALLTQKGLTRVLPHGDVASLLDSPHAQVVRALAASRRPRYALILDQTTDEPADDKTRPFRSLRDIAATVTALDEIRLVADFLVRGLGLRPEHLPVVLADTQPGPAATRFSDVLGTMAANLLLQRPTAFVPLMRADLPALRRAALGLTAAAEGAVGLSTTATATILTVLRQRVRERHPDEATALWPDAVERWVQRALSRLADGLRSLPAQIDESPDLLDLLPALPGLVLRAPGAHSDSVMA